jgi:nucleoid-associated protein YgaU
MASSGSEALAQATLRVADGEPTRTSLKFYYNPSEYTITKGQQWEPGKTKGSQGAKAAPPPEFKSTNPQTIQLEIFFDDWEAGKGKVAEDVATLLDWTTPTSASYAKKKPRPPLLAFDWGKNPALANFQGFLKTVTAKYTLFDDKGMPIRATANITLEEVPKQTGKQNPTSGGRAGYRTHLLLEGDSLASIAYSEYGDAALWRGLANYNRIDDPLRLRPGTTLFVPEIGEAKRLGSSQ